MVQVIEPTRIGSQLGEALQRGTAAGSELGMQRGMLSQGLNKLSALKPGESTSIDLAKALIEATQGIPGAERYVGQLYSMLSPQFQAQSIPPGGATAAPQEPFSAGKGYLSSAPLTQPQKMQAAKELTKQGIPLEQGIDLVNKISSGSEQALSHIQSMLSAQGVTDVEMPYATQMAQVLSEREGIADPNELIKRVRSSLDGFRKLDSIFVPGAGRAVKKGISAALSPFEGGLIGKLIDGGPSRQEAIRELDPLVKDLYEKGFDPILREKLANQGLSPTEIQESIFRAVRKPEYEMFKKSLDGFPKPSKSREKNMNMLKDFVGKNVERGVPLTVLKYDLWKNKGYDWRQVAEAYRLAREEGLAINERQELEQGEFLSEPPRESLLDIFRDWHRPLDVFSGRK